MYNRGMFRQWNLERHAIDTVSHNITNCSYPHRKDYQFKVTRANYAAVSRFALVWQLRP